MCQGKHYPYLRPVSCSCNATHNRTGQDTNHTEEDYQLLLIGSCTSYNQSSCQISIGGCPYNLRESSRMMEYNNGVYAIALDRNHSCSRVNQVVCGAIHRTGFLCSRCQKGYGLAIYSRSWDCHPCPADLPGSAAWVIYLVLDFIPLTAFFLLTVMLDLQAIKPPFSAYIFFCQFFAIFIRSNSHTSVHLNKYSYAPLRVATLSAIDLWNLDFLRRIIPPFCLSQSLGNFDSIQLEFSSGLLPLVLVAAVCLAIELHARDTKVVVLLWRPFHRCLASWRRTWNPQASMINVFITFLVLSMSKMMTISVYSLFTVNAFKRFPTISHKQLLPSILYLDPSKKLSDIPTVMAMIALSLFSLVLLPMALNIVYPLKCLRQWKRLGPICNSRLLYYFMDAWQGHFRNPTTTGVCCDYRHASVLFFVHRLVTWLVLAYTVIRMETTYESTILCANILYLGGMAIFYALVRPYTKTAANVVESLLFGLAGAVLLVIICIPTAISLPHKRHMRLHANVVLLGIATPTAVLCGYMVKWLVVKVVRRVRGPRERKRESADSEVWHRLEHPDDYYSPLLPQDRPVLCSYT